MRAFRQLLGSGIALVALFGATAAPAQAQGKAKEKRYAVSGDKAMSVTRTVLVQQGYHVVRVEHVGVKQVVYYREKKNKHGKGKGPLQRLVIRSVHNRVVFEDASPSVMVDIDLKLKL